MKFKDNYFDSLILSQSNILFTFGNVGSGKTCFFGHSLNHIYYNHLLELNRKSNLEGYRHCDLITKNMRNNILPDKTLSGELKNVDFKITRDLGNGKIDSTYFTYMDMPGDDLKNVAPNASDVTGEITGGDLPPHIEQFFQYDGLNLTLIGVVDFNDAEEQFDLFHKFLNHITSQYNYKIQKCLIIVTKWDENQEYDNLKQFIDDKGKQCLFWMKYKVDMWSAFPFSIGTIDSNFPQKLSEPNYHYCAPILDWLISTSGYNKLIEFDGEDLIIQTRNVDEENKRIVNVFRFIGSTMLPYFSSALLEISKMADSVRNIRGKKTENEMNDE